MRELEKWGEKMDIKSFFSILNSTSGNFFDEELQS